MVVVTTEVVNLVVLITNNSVQDIIMNFLALVVISEFDNFFLTTEKDAFIAKALKDGEFQRTADGEPCQLDEIFKIQVTTSKSAMVPLEQNMLRPKVAGEDGAAEETQRKVLEGEPTYIYVDFYENRTCMNGVARVMYLFLRAWYVSCFFYFAPFISILISYYFVEI